MKAYITSIGEQTTQICCDQMERYGYDVILLDQKESISDKYKRFINEANEDCLKIDADIIPNERVTSIIKASQGVYIDLLMIQFSHYDLYKNKISAGNPVLYKKECLDIIRKNIDKISPDRPETSAWRLDDIKMKTFTSGTTMGLHGFGSDKKTMLRAKQNKIERRQIQHFDFDLAFKIAKLYEKFDM